METQLTDPNTAARLDLARGVSMMGSAGALRKILVTVVASLSDDLPKIDAALLADDVPTANRLLHAIKGYMPILAGDALVAQVTVVEKLSKTEPVAVVQPSYLQLAPELQGLLDEIQVYLASA